MGGRADLYECGVVEFGVEKVLGMYLNGGEGRGVIYWVFRCLCRLVCVYEEEGGINGRNGEHWENESVDSYVKEDLEAVEKYKEALARTKIVHWVLLSMATLQLDPITLEWGFQFLVHYPMEKYVTTEQDLVMEACSLALSSGSHALFPTLHKLACSILCTVITKDRASVAAYLHQCPEWTTNFIRIALDTLPLNNDGSTFQQVVLCILSHVLLLGDTKLTPNESEELLRHSLSIMEKQRSNLFLQQCSCWILWILSSERPTPIKSTESISHCIEALRIAMASNSTQRDLILVCLGAILEITTFHKLKPRPITEEILKLISQFPQDDALQELGCRIINNLCKFKSAADYIVSVGGLSFVHTSLFSDSSVLQREAVHFMYKLCSFTDTKELSLENLHAMLGICQNENDPYLSAKSLYILTCACDTKREDFVPLSILTLEAIKESMETFSTNKNLQNFACLALKKLATGARKAEVPMDISGVIRPVLKAQREHQKDSFDAMWALTGVEYELEPELVEEVANSMIDVMTAHSGKSGKPFRGDILIAAMASLSDLFCSSPSRTMGILGMEVVERIVEVVNTVIYACLDKHGNHPFIFCFGFNVLKRLCDSEKCQDLIVKYGGIVAVIDGMGANPNNANIQRKGCSILRSLSANDLEVKISVVESDGVDVIISTMMSHGDNEEVLVEVFQALSCLSVDKESRNFIAQQGGIILITNAVKNLMDSVPIQEIGLKTLCNLASDASWELLESSNMLAVVRESLEKYPQEEFIQRKGFTLLANLSMRSSDLRNGIASSECLPIIKEGIKNHCNQSKIVASAFSILYNVSSTDEFTDLLLEEGTVSLIIHVMMLNIETLQVQQMGCKLLCKACDKEVLRTIVKASGGFEATIFAMLAHPSSETVQDFGTRLLSCSSLHKSIYGSPEMCSHIAAAILCAMNHFPECSSIQENSIIALRNFSRHEESKEVFKLMSIRVGNALREAEMGFPDKCASRAKELLDNVEL